MGLEARIEATMKSPWAQLGKGAMGRQKSRFMASANHAKQSRSISFLADELESLIDPNNGAWSDQLAVTFRSMYQFTPSNTKFPSRGIVTIKKIVFQKEVD